MTVLQVQLSRTTLRVATRMETLSKPEEVESESAFLACLLLQTSRCQTRQELLTAPATVIDTSSE